MSASAFSQDWQPKTIVLDNKGGLFLPYPVMDSITVKLIERNSLMRQNLSYSQLVQTLQDKNDVLAQKSENVQETALKWEKLYNIEIKKFNLLNENFNDQKTIISNNKKKARRNGLYLFGGGVVVGAAGLLLLIN